MEVKRDLNCLVTNLQNIPLKKVSHTGLKWHKWQNCYFWMDYPLRINHLLQTGNVHWDFCVNKHNRLWSSPVWLPVIPQTGCLNTGNLFKLKPACLPVNTCFQVEVFGLTVPGNAYGENNNWRSAPAIDQFHDSQHWSDEHHFCLISARKGQWCFSVSV